MATASKDTDYDYAVFRTGGKQYRASLNSRLSVEKLEGEVGGEVRFEDVLLVAKDGNYTIGTPLVANAVVVGEVVAQVREPKKIHFRFKNKTHGGRRLGHRQQKTDVVIKLVSTSADELRKKSAAKKKPAKAAVAEPPEVAEKPGKVAATEETVKAATKKPAKAAATKATAKAAEKPAKATATKKPAKTTTTNATAKTAEKPAKAATAETAATKKSAKVAEKPAKAAATKATAKTATKKPAKAATKAAAKKPAAKAKKVAPKPTAKGKKDGS